MFDVCKLKSFKNTPYTILSTKKNFTYLLTYLLTVII